jgi:hypothetical protein
MKKTKESWNMHKPIEEVIEDLKYSLENIEDINDPQALGAVKDEVLSFNEYLALEKEAVNGNTFQPMNVKIKYGEPLPSEFGRMVLDTPEGTPMGVTIQSIKFMQWVEEEQAILIQFLGTLTDIKPKLATIPQWCEIKGITIKDPDGFNREDEFLMERLFSEAEFDEGVRLSTVIMPVKEKEAEEKVERLPKASKSKKPARKAVKK